MSTLRWAFSWCLCNCFKSRSFMAFFPHCSLNIDWRPSTKASSQSWYFHTTQPSVKASDPHCLSSLKRSGSRPKCTQSQFSCSNTRPSEAACSCYCPASLEISCPWNTRTHWLCRFGLPDGKRWVRFLFMHKCWPLTDESILQFTGCPCRPRTRTAWNLLRFSYWTIGWLFVGSLSDKSCPNLS